MEQRREGRTARHGHAETSFSDALFRRRAFFLGPDHSAHAYKYGVLLVCSSNTPPPCDGTWLQQGSYTQSPVLVLQLQPAFTCYKSSTDARTSRRRSIVELDGSRRHERIVLGLG